MFDFLLVSSPSTSQLCNLLSLIWLFTLLSRDTDRLFDFYFSQDGNSSTGFVLTDFTIPARDKPVSHPPADPPLCENVRNVDCIAYRSCLVIWTAACWKNKLAVISPLSLLWYNMTIWFSHFSKKNVWYKACPWILFPLEEHGSKQSCILNLQSIYSLAARSSNTPSKSLQ